MVMMALAKGTEMNTGSGGMLNSAKMLMFQRYFEFRFSSIFSDLYTACTMPCTIWNLSNSAMKRLPYHALATL